MTSRNKLKHSNVTITDKIQQPSQDANFDKQSHGTTSSSDDNDDSLTRNTNKTSWKSIRDAKRVKFLNKVTTTTEKEITRSDRFYVLPNGSRSFLLVKRKLEQHKPSTPSYICLSVSPNDKTSKRCSRRRYSTGRVANDKNEL